VQYVNQHGAEQYETTTGELAAVWSKLEAYAARFALIVHFVRLCAGDLSLKDAERIDESSIDAGIRLADWFGGEARRIYVVLAETESEQADRKLVEVIGRHGGEITARDLSSNYRSRFPTVEDAELSLNRLAEKDHGGWFYQEPGSKGGRPTSAFRLNVLPHNRKTSENTENNQVMRLEDGNGQLSKTLSNSESDL